MDPLSISASAITLIHAAGSITTTLYRLVQSLKHADDRIKGLYNELNHLTSFLEAVERTLKGCRALDLALVEEDLWHQSELALVDCQATLSELGQLVNKIKDHARSKGFGWRARAVVDMNLYGADIATFRDKIYKSNLALQTILHTVTVSLSLRNNTSQELILFELDQLKSSIGKALRASVRPAAGLSHGFNASSDSRVARNLRNLVEAAQHFHSAASSNATTVRSESIAPWRSSAQFGAPMSLVGDLPAYRRERVEMFIRDTQPHNGVQDTPTGMTSPPPGSVRSLRTSLITQLPKLTVPASNETIAEEDDDDEAEFERLFLDGLEDLARDSIRNHDFNKAIELLNEAMKREQVMSNDDEHHRRLQTQLALCYFFQGDWVSAEPIVMTLAKPKKNLDLVLCNMLHALSIAHLSTYSFDKALDLCKQALQGKKKWLKAQGAQWDQVPEYSVTLGLLATIYETTGNDLAADIYRRKLPQGYIYRHPGNRVEFIANNREILEKILGDDLPSFGFESSVPGFYELDAGVSGNDYPAPAPIERRPTIYRSRTISNGDSSPLRARRHIWERLESDTSKEVFCAAPKVTNHEEFVTVLGKARSPLKRRLTRMFTRKDRRTEAYGEQRQEAPQPLQRSPVTRWFKGKDIFGLKKVKSVLQKRSEDNIKPDTGKSFKILHVEKVTLNQPVNLFASSSLDASTYSSISPVFDPIPSRRNEIAPTSTTSTINWRNASGERKNRAGLDAESRHREEADTERGGASGWGASILMPAELPADPPKSVTSVRVAVAPKPALSNGPPSSLILPQTGVYATLSHLAELLAGLSQIRDAEKLHAARFELEIISAELKSLSNDAVLRHDVLRIIKSLSESEASDVDEMSDSGYSTMSVGSSSETTATEPTSPLSSNCSETTDITVPSIATKKHSSKRRDRPSLKRAFSWKVDNEHFNKRDLGSFKGKKSRDRIVSPAGQKTQVSWALDSDGTKPPRKELEESAEASTSDIDEKESTTSEGMRVVTELCQRQDKLGSIAKWDRWKRIADGSESSLS